jgi:argininosuccinate lyase
MAVNRSIDVDFRLWPHDIRLSGAWASALIGARVISRAEASRMHAGLARVARRLERGARLRRSDEDVHTLIDRLLHEEIGALASRLHTGRSRNDQVATAARMLTMHELGQLAGEVRRLQQACVSRASGLLDVIMPAYTHLQRAQPVSAAHWMLSHFWALQRDQTRLAAARRSAGVLPLGSGAIAGSAFRVNRRRLARALGFHTVSPNSIDAVGDRDFMADAVFALTGLAVHLSRLAEDLILFGTSEFGFVRFGDPFSTGSSMMPQKRNPDALELARAFAARLSGDLQALLGILKGTPSGYNKDYQEDKRALFDSLDAMQALLPAIRGTIRTLRFNKRKMAGAVSSPMMATDLADYLVRRRVSFREAHRAVGLLVRKAEESRVDLANLPLSSFKAAHPLLDRASVHQLLPSTSLRNREVDGGTGPRAVAKQLTEARLILQSALV